MESGAIKQLYYITHVANIPSILKLRILSYELINAEKIEFVPIYDEHIVDSRKNRRTPDGRSLWNFANLYFQGRNAMLYRVLCEKNVKDIAIIAVKKGILNYSHAFIATGNTASLLSEILDAKKGLKYIDKKTIEQKWWKETDGSKRKMMAEVLVPDIVPPEFIQAVYVASHEIAERLRRDSNLGGISVIPEPAMFFEPSRQSIINLNLIIVEGDMFFSRMHTLTVSVNCVGIMGKGLASRAKYQFPDVYVAYQDLCRNRVLRMGKPIIYKREKSFDYELADDPSTLVNGNIETWFLLFATKQHWRDRGDINGIEQGLRWLVDNYKKLG
jgi:L-rhamnose mutarotase